jgi:tight adherence protein B
VPWINLIEWGGLIFAVLVAAGIAYRQLLPAPLQTDSDALVDPDTDGSETRSPMRANMRTLNLRIEPFVFVLVTVAISCCVFFVVLELFPNALWVAVIAAVAVTIMSFFMLADISQMLRRKFEEKLVDALDLVYAAIQGGLPPRQALQVAAESSKGAVKRELNEIVARLDYGLSVEKAVERIRSRYDTEAVRLFSQALVAKWHSGSDFGLLISSVTVLVRDQIRMRIMISGQLSGARYAAIFTGALPYLLVPVFMWKQPDWFEPLSTNPNGGSYLMVAVLLQVGGYLWLRRLLRAEL